MTDLKSQLEASLELTRRKAGDPCKGCGTPTVAVGPPINDICPNKECRYDWEQAKVTFQANPGELETLRAALWKCRERFEEYVASHRAKAGIAEQTIGDGNQEMINLIDRALVGNHD